MTFIWILTVLAIVGFAIYQKRKFIKSKINVVYKIILSQYDNKSIEAVIDYETNVIRIKAGLKFLKTDWNSKLTSQNRNKEMIADGYASHEGYADDAQRLVELGADEVGENVAFGWSSGKMVVKKWMESPGHRKNILNPDYDAYGIDVQSDKKGRKYFCQIFIGEDEI